MRQVATAYTGANISITIGGKFIANAFGISWELSQNKRPIYGYNSMYYDSVASGQVIVMGQLYVNYQHPNYLSSLLANYFKEKSTINQLSTGGLGETSSRNNANGVFNDYTTRGGLARQERNFDDQLNAIFNNPSLLANLGNIFTSGESVSGFKNFKQTQVYGQAADRIMQEGGAHGRTKVTSGEYLLEDNEGVSLAFSGNMGPGVRRTDYAIYARPDQFTNNSGPGDPINIVVTHGDPGLNDKSSGILSYTPASSIILRGVHFIGEAQQVMADDQPIMETYKFIARSKESLISQVYVPPETPPPEETTATTQPETTTTGQ